MSERGSAESFRAIAAETIRPFAERGAVRRVQLVVLIDAAGMGMLVSFLTLYLVRVVGLGPGETGVAVSVTGAASILVLMPLSRLATVLGTRRALVAFSLCRAGSFLAIMLASSYVSVLFALVAAGSFSRIVTPVTQSTLICLEPDEDRQISTLAASRMVRNSGLAAGGLPAAVAAALDEPLAYRAVLVLAALVFVASALIAHRLPPLPSAPPARVRRRASIYRNRRFVVLTILNCLFLLHASILLVGFPLWVLGHTMTGGWVASVMLTVNTVFAVVLQVAMSRGSEQPQMARTMLRRCGYCLAVVCAVTPLTAWLPGSAAVALFVALAVLLTIGEIWNSAGAWGLVLSHLEQATRDQHLAFFNVGSSAATVIWPAVLGALLTFGAVGWLVLSGVFLVLSASVGLVKEKEYR